MDVCTTRHISCTSARVIKCIITYPFSPETLKHHISDITVPLYWLVTQVMVACLLLTTIWLLHVNDSRFWRKLYLSTHLIIAPSFASCCSCLHPLFWAQLRAGISGCQAAEQMQSSPWRGITASPGVSLLYCLNYYSKLIKATVQARFICNSTTLADQYGNHRSIAVPCT